MKQYFILSIICISLLSCEKSKDHYIRVKNNSDFTICCQIDSDYPADSLLFLHRMGYQLPLSIPPSSSYSYVTGSGCRLDSWYVEFYDAEINHSGYLSFYLAKMDSEIVEAIENGLTIDGYIDFQIVARYDLRREDIERLDWMITYPPSEEMNGIHMWLAPETITDD